MSDDDKFKPGEVDLVTLMGVDLSQIEEMRFGEVMPRIFADFECGEPTMEELKNDQGQVIGALVKFPWKVIGIHDASKAKADGVEDPATLLGKIHNDVAVVKGATNVKYLKGYIADVGGNKNQALGEAIKSVGGKRVRAIIAHRRDKNDPDRIYAGLTRYKPIQATA